MARIIESHFNPKVTLEMYTLIEGDKDVLHVFNEGDIVTDLRYAKDGEIKRITGRVEKINYTVRPVTRSYTSVEKAKSSFSDDVKIKSLIIDCSDQYHSNVIEIDPRDIIEFRENMNNAKKVILKLSYFVDIEVELSSEVSNIFSIKEGEMLSGVEFLSKLGDITLDKAQYVATIYNFKTLQPTKFVFISNEKIYTIDSLALKNVSGIVPKVEMNVSTLNDAISNAEFGMLNLDSGKIDDTIRITKNISLRGNRAGLSANLQGIEEMEETIISGKIEVSDGVSVELDGITLTNTAFISVVNSEDVTLKNCKIGGYEPNIKKTMPILTNGEAVKMVVKNCKFTDNQIVGEFKCYNGFELNAKLKDGSEFSGNYFSKDFVTHNSINIYDVEDGATITIKNNTWEKSANAIRIGIKGEPECTILIENNTYFETDSDPAWAGLVLVQPYGKQTTSMKNCTIIISGTKHNDDMQLYYLYAGSNDMQFTEENTPTIIVK